ncbi:inhibitor of nuclear factor kappa-B kinase-interacting protein isoform X2 [Phyllopteryx taeniolatus]|uniref:inhibitor of nuclear factor kappa-B kinase-interacting protein isoform X2 n=1 Tax=Phyllopteryx taeniolatus TaxID=161469 RepID=UPI002AD4A61D|nr:inhibitor of nuclear factor kappa-B kinase-interacting protein isoform X2 [Phyllopteryx taeniolatus]
MHHVCPVACHVCSTELDGAATKCEVLPNGGKIHTVVWKDLKCVFNGGASREGSKKSTPHRLSFRYPRNEQFCGFLTRALPEKRPPCFVLRLQLAASEDDLRAARSAVSSASGLRRDVAALHLAMGTLQGEDSSASGDLQGVNVRFLDVTKTWQERLAGAAAELASLKAESREAHAGVAERVNEAERRARSLAQKLEELEDSTGRNARAVERAEEDDAKRVQAQLDWNTRQIHKMDENVNRLARQEAELSAQLRDHLPRAKECEEQLPRVEEALRSIVKLGADLSGAESRLEEVTLQVFSAEDNMLKTLNLVVGMRQEMDALQARGAVLKMKSELAVVREAVHELTRVLRGGQANEEEEEEEPDEEWEEPAGAPRNDVAR